MDKEKAKRNLEAILDKMRDDTDIAALHEYHKLYKKEISLFKRSWAAAWLFMYYDRKEIPQAPKADKMTNSKNIKKPGNPPVKFSAENPAKLRADKPPIEINLSEEESKRLFISIGKNRRLFPKEVITLIMSKTSTPREDIGIIRILDNYSFVQVRDSKADEIINALTGVRFRGRTLTVNYAKPKSSDNDDN